MALGEIQTALNGGELSPKLYARTDLAKFEAGAALLRNFIVDYRGGVTNRPGTRFIAAVKNVTGAKRLIPFIVSTDAAYVLEFGNLYIRVYLAGVFLVEVVTPYLEADLALIKFTQSADVLTLVHPSYPPANLSRTGTSTFVYAILSIGPGIDPPVVTTMIAPHSGPYSFGYLITAVDLDGKEESLGSNPGVKHSEGMNEMTNRVIGLTWTPPSQAVSRYNIYKWGPIDSVTMNPATVWGFIGTAQTNTFTDNNIAPDFSKQPPGWGDPFSGGQIQSIVVVAGGAGYDGVSGDWPTAVPYVPLVITGDGTGAAGYAVIDHATGKIVGVYLTNPGKNYTNAAITADGQGGAGATFAVTFSDPGALDPACTAYVQQRRVFAGSNLKPETLVMSQVGRYNNFNVSPISLATDAIPLSIAGEQVNTIKSMVGVSYGLLLFTTSEVHLLNGGSPYASITPESVSIQHQSSVGANDLPPIRVDSDVLYGQNKGNRIRNLAFAWQKQSFQGSDISALAAHLFDGFLTLEWAWSEEPFKIAWLVRDDGRMVSLTYAPDQEVAAWCRHDTQGRFKSVCSVPEGETNAVYVIVERYIPANNLTPTNLAGNWVSYIERFQERAGCCLFDAWFLDAALGITKPAPATALFLSGDTGAGVTLTTTTSATGPRTPDFTGARAFDSSSMFNTSSVIVGTDWTGARLFVYSPFDAKFMSFNINTSAIITAATANAFMGGGLTYGEDGFLYGVGSPSNQVVLTKINPVTGATVGTFGVTSSNFSTNATHWAFPGDFDVCFDVNNNPVMVSTCLNSAPSLNECTVLNLTTMAWEGVNFSLDEPSRNAPVTKGAQGQAFVFAVGSTSFRGSSSCGLYRVDLTIVPTMTKIATINPNVVPTWTHINTCYGIFFDATDGNVIGHFETDALTAYSAASTYFTNDLVSSLGHDFVAVLNNFTGFAPAIGGNAHWTDLGVSGPAQEYRVIKWNVTTGAMMWSVVVLNGFSAVGRMSDNSVSKGLYIFQAASAPRTLHQINTLTGVDTTSAVLANIFPGSQSFNDTLGILLSYSSYGGAPPALISGASWGNKWATFGPAGAPAQVGSFTVPGQVVQVGCGKVLLTAVANSASATGTVIAPLDIEIPDDPNGTPLYINPGDWTLTPPVSNISGLGHLEGKEVWALADGVVEGPFTVTGGALSAPLTTPATNVVVGLKYIQQIQTLYLTMDDLQPGSIQGKRKFVPAAVLRLDCSKGLKIGQDFDNLTAVPDCGNIDTNFVGLNPGELFTGDAYVVLGAAWDDKGEVCIEQDDPLPASVLGIIVQVVPGDTGR